MYAKFVFFTCTKLQLSECTYCMNVCVYVCMLYGGFQIPARASASARVGISGSGEMSKQMPMRRYSNFGNSTAAIAAAAAAATAGSQPAAVGASSSSAPLTSLQPFSSTRAPAVSVCRAVILSLG